MYFELLENLVTVVLELEHMLDEEELEEENSRRAEETFGFDVVN